MHTTTKFHVIVVNSHTLRTGEYLYPWNARVSVTLNYLQTLLILVTMIHLCSLQDFAINIEDGLRFLHTLRTGEYLYLVSKMLNYFLSL